MAKKIICFALGGHISSQNASFRKLAELLEPEGYILYGAKDGFKAFETGEVYELNHGIIPREFAGFLCGSGRASLTKKDGSIDEQKLERAKYFLKTGGFDVVVGSGGDDHGRQMAVLNESLEQRVNVFMFNKTMDNDLGGRDNGADAPYTDFTNGFHTAVTVGVNTILNHFAGAWTNNLPYLVGHFGRETNWVGIALAYWGLADRIIYGELPEDHPGHSIETLHELILESQDENEKRYGRRFAMIIVPEGTRVHGIQHISQKVIDPHGHHKLNPEVLAVHIKEALELQYKMKTQTAGITYEMRNTPPTQLDMELAESSAVVIANAILSGMQEGESIFRIRDGKIVHGIAPIIEVSKKRYASFYPRPLIDQGAFRVTDEIGKYYKPLFGERRELSGLLPVMPKIRKLF